MAEVTEWVDRSREAEPVTPEQILEKSYELHNKFDEKVWKKDNPERPSFHNSEHIKAVHEPSDSYFKVLKETGEDPLDVKRDLDRWNQMLDETGGEHVTLEELITIKAEETAFHDFGNIMKDIEVDEEGNITPIFLESYTAGQVKDEYGNVIDERVAEHRSKDMYIKYTNSRNDLTPGEKEKRIRLGCHLMEMTKAGFSPTDPTNTDMFAVFIRVHDQIGNDYFSKNDDRVDGLIEEKAAEDPSGSVDEWGFRNFSVWRLAQLVPDEEKRRILVEKMWNKKLKAPDDSYSKEKTTFEKLNDPHERTIYRARKVARDLINDNDGRGLTDNIEAEIQEKTGFSVNELTEGDWGKLD